MERLFVHFLFRLTPYKNQIWTLYLDLTDIAQIPISNILQNMGCLPRLEYLTIPGGQAESSNNRWALELRGSLPLPLRLSTIAYRLSYLSIPHILYIPNLELPTTLSHLSCEYGHSEQRDTEVQENADWGLIFDILLTAQLKTLAIRDIHIPSNSFLWPKRSSLIYVTHLQVRGSIHTLRRWFTMLAFPNVTALIIMLSPTRWRLAQETLGSVHDIQRLSKLAVCDINLHAGIGLASTLAVLNALWPLEGIVDLNLFLSHYLRDGVIESDELNLTSSLFEHIQPRNLYCSTDKLSHWWLTLLSVIPMRTVERLNMVSYDEDEDENESDEDWKGLVVSFGGPHDTPGSSWIERNIRLDLPSLIHLRLLEIPSLLADSLSMWIHAPRVETMFVKQDANDTFPFPSVLAPDSYKGYRSVTSLTLSIFADGGLDGCGSPPNPLIHFPELETLALVLDFHTRGGYNPTNLQQRLTGQDPAVMLNYLQPDFFSHHIVSKLVTVVVVVIIEQAELPVIRDFLEAVPSKMDNLEEFFNSECELAQRKQIPSMLFAVEEREWKHSDSGKSLGRNVRWIGRETKDESQPVKILNEICGKTNYLRPNHAE
jgi:hypothetical protein